MDQKKQAWWIDALIIMGMIALVLIFCQPFGRKWDNTKKELYTGSEGVYSFDPDSYFYLRRAKEYTEKGITSIRLSFGRNEDPLMTGTPSEGEAFSPNLLSIIAALLWFALHALGIRVGIYQLAIHLSGVLLSLFTVPIYLFLRKRISRTASVFGALVAALAVPFFRHSCTGVFDTDPLIGILAILAILSLYECVLDRRKKKQITYGVISCVAIVLLYLSWNAFFVYAAIAIGTTAVGLFAIILKERKGTEKKNIDLVPFCFIGIILIISLILGGEAFWSTVKGFFPSGGAEGGLWPSASKYVSELQVRDFVSTKNFWYVFLQIGGDYLSYFGGLLSFLFFVYSCVLCCYLFWREKKRSGVCRERLFLFVAVGTWGLGTALMTFFGIRFMEFVVFPEAIIMAFGFAKTEALLRKETTVFKKRVFVIGLAVVVFSLTVIAWPLPSVLISGGIMVFGYFFSKKNIQKALSVAIPVTIIAADLLSDWLITSLQNMLIEKPVEDAMVWVKENTDENSVLAEYWSFGFIYQYYGERRTLSDGGTFNGEYYYWLATMLTTDNPKLAIGIARMIQYAGMDGSRTATKYCGDKKEAAELLKQILVLSREEAEAFLSERTSFSSEQIGEILEYSHPQNCPDIYFVISFELFKEMSSFTYYRDWDFSGNSTSTGGTMVSISSGEKPADDTVVVFDLCEMGEMTEWKALLQNNGDAVEGWLCAPDGTHLDCVRTIYVKDRKIVYDRAYMPEESERGCINEEALVIFEEGGRLSVVACEKALPDSVLFRMYLLEEEGVGSFENVFEAEHPMAVSGETSKIQRWIGTEKTQGAAACGIRIWKAVTNE